MFCLFVLTRDDVKAFGFTFLFFLRSVGIMRMIPVALSNLDFYLKVELTRLERH